MKYNHLRKSGCLVTSWKCHHVHRCSKWVCSLASCYIFILRGWPLEVYLAIGVCPMCPLWLHVPSSVHPVLIRVLHNSQSKHRLGFVGSGCCWLWEGPAHFSAFPWAQPLDPWAYVLGSVSVLSSQVLMPGGFMCGHWYEHKRRMFSCYQIWFVNIK